MSTTSFPPAARLDDVLVTNSLPTRPWPTPNLEIENAALHAIARETSNGAQAVLDALTRAALILCNAGSTGVSLLETLPDGKRLFRWVALAGEYALHLGGSTPGDFSPCGTSVARGVPQLFSYPERYFTYFQQSRPVIVEGLVIPFTLGSVVGTIWVVSHSVEQQFTNTDVRIMNTLAAFTCAALKDYAAPKKNSGDPFESVLSEQTDEATIATLYDQHAGTVLALIRRIVKEPAVAERLLLVVFEEIYRKRHDAISAPRTSTALNDLMMSARNSAINWMKSTSIQRTPDQKAEENNRTLIGPARHEEFDLGLWKAFDTLTSEDRRALSLYMLDGYSALAISEVFGESEQDTEKRLSHALANLSAK